MKPKNPYIRFDKKTCLMFVSHTGRKKDEIKIPKKTTIQQELDKLQEGDSLVVVTKDKDGIGYYIGIGDLVTANSWAVTEQELITLRNLLNRKFPLSIDNWFTIYNDIVFEDSENKEYITVAQGKEILKKIHSFFYGNTGKS